MLTEHLYILILAETKHVTLTCILHTPELVLILDQCVTQFKLNN